MTNRDPSLGFLSPSAAPDRHLCRSPAKAGWPDRNAYTAACYNGGVRLFHFVEASPTADLLLRMLPPVDDRVGRWHGVVRETVERKVYLRNALLHALDEVRRATKAMLVRSAVGDAREGDDAVVEEEADERLFFLRVLPGGTGHYLAHQVGREGDEVRYFERLRNL